MDSLRRISCRLKRTTEKIVLDRTKTDDKENTKMKECDVATNAGARAKLDGQPWHNEKDTKKTH